MGALTKAKAKQIDGLGDLALLDEITAALISDASADAQNLIKAANAAAMRVVLGLVPGTDVQAQSANLNTFAGITPSANVQSLLAAASYTAMKTLLELAAIASSGSASDLASGTVPMARLNVGTAANQLVQLNAYGQLPSVDGSLLTDINSGWKQIGTVSLSGSSSGVISGIPPRKQLLIVVADGLLSTSKACHLDISTDGGSSSTSISVTGTGTSTTGHFVGLVTGADQPLKYISSVQANGSNTPSALVDTMFPNTTAAINWISYNVSSATFTGGTFTVYGMN